MTANTLPRPHEKRGVTMTTRLMATATKVAIVAEVLDLGVDYGADLHALVDDLEADGFHVTDDPDGQIVDEIVSRVAAYSTEPTTY